MGWTEEMDIEGTRNLFERSVREVKRAKAIFMMYSVRSRYVPSLSLRDHSKMTSPGQGGGGPKKVQKTVTSIV